MPEDFNLPTDSVDLPATPTLTDPIMPVQTDPVMPVQEVPSMAPPPTKPLPATLPQTSRRSPLPVILLLLLCLFSIAAATFWYFQNQDLISQINTIQSTLDQRQLDLIPTPEITQEPTPTSTVSATPTSTSSATVSHTSAFSNINAVINLAQQTNPQAQLLMITGENLQDDSQATYKYWFRKAHGTKSYVFVQVSPNKSPQLFNQATVSPDNNIPDLIDTFTANQAGQDSTDLLTNNYAPSSPISISAKYLKALPNNADYATPILLWQFVYKYPPSSGIKDVVLQFDAQKGTLLYTSSPTK